MATTFDGDNLLVTLSAPTGGVLALDVQVDLYSDWKEWMLASFSNMKYPPLFTTFGGNDIIAGQLQAGSYYPFNNTAGWRIKPDESSHDVQWTGNLFPLDSTLPIFVPTDGAFTVFINGLQPITQQQFIDKVDDIHGQLQRSVFINTEAIVNGNGYQQTPYNNFPDAVDYAEANGLQVLRLQADASLDRNLANFELIGIDLPTLDLNGFSASSLIVRECTLTGTQGGPQFPLLALVSNIRNLSDFNGSMLTVTVETRIGIAAGAFCLINEVIPAIGGSPWELDMGATGAASTVQMQNISGGLSVTNMDNASDQLHMAFVAGTVTIDATCTAGIIIITGSVKVADNSGVGCTVDVSGVEHELLMAHVMEDGETFEEGLRLIRASAAGDIVQLPDGSYLIKSKDGLKDRIDGSLGANNSRNIDATDST